MYIFLFLPRSTARSRNVFLGYWNVCATTSSLRQIRERKNAKLAVSIIQQTFSSGSKHIRQKRAGITGTVLTSQQIFNATQDFIIAHYFLSFIQTSRVAKSKTLFLADLGVKEKRFLQYRYNRVRWQKCHHLAVTKCQLV